MSNVNVTIAQNTIVDAHIISAQWQVVVFMSFVTQTLLPGVPSLPLLVIVTMSHNNNYPFPRLMAPVNIRQHLTWQRL